MRAPERGDPGPAEPSARHVPAFFLAEPPGEDPAGDAVRLAEGEEEHALRVLRLEPGAACTGLDGAGGRWPLVVEEARARRFRARVVGPREEEPRAGEPGAPLPWIEVAVAWPRRSRGEDMLGRLVQLGAAAVTPLAARRAGPGEVPERPPERWWRVAREHAKQCGRLWLPELGARTSPAELVAARPAGAIAFGDPAAGLGLDTWVRSLPLGPSLVGTRARPIVLAIGPEGGFDREERTALLEAGASPVRLGPHVLRIETAAEAALAVAAALLSA